MNGIILLRPNMDKFFEGIEECMICLFVLFGASSAFPRFKCPQCRKKFHYACIVSVNFFCKFWKLTFFIYSANGFKQIITAFVRSASLSLFRETLIFVISLKIITLPQMHAFTKITFF